ncbi:MAG: hypothetical protein L0Y72_13850 [Gemmataceae bacterium]|nr:hypothetical protein [Gemmataceae bacterium]MCI0740125.1 hypothetical protein [Gemmataceae bacterium]
MGALTRKVDGKGRLALGQRFANQIVIVKEVNGTLEITPAVAIPAKEAWLYENDQALALVRAGIQQAKARQFSN